VPATQFIVPSINGYNPDLKPWPYEPEQAKALLTEAKADGVPVDAEIVMIGRRGIHAGVTEKLEAIHAMLVDVGFNVTLRLVEVAEWVDSYTQPFAQDRPPNLIHAMHDNNNGDAVFTAFFKYHTDGGQSALSDPRVDSLIEQATVAVNPERRKLWQDMFRLVNEEIVADVPLFHMVGYTRVSPSVNFKPTISTNSEIQIGRIPFN
jgi:peptide/nickel transport system substrate-binding protein